MTQRVFIVGACSAIATEVARQYASNGAKLCLLARNKEKLQMLSDDLIARGAKHVEQIEADVNTTRQHGEYLETAQKSLDGLDLILIAHGTLPDQQECEASVELTLNEVLTNGVSTVSFMTLAANYFETQNKGCLAVISSVAGDRGRQSNYTYGASKALVSTFAEGMISRFADSQVNVLLIKPGFVDTPMTAEFDKGAMWAQPEQVAEEIIKAVEKKKDILYVPFFWWPIMQIIKLVPNFIFKKLSL